jgi:hypothetical protein
MNTYENIKLIGLVGTAGSGKDTVADSLKDYGWKKFAFAKALKDMCIEFLGLSYDDAYTQEGKMKFNDFWGMTNREILQKVGTDAFRNGFHPDTWVKIAELQIQKLLNEGKKIIVTDCRFDNEAALIEKLGGIVMKVERTGYENNLTSSEKTHASEKGVDGQYIARTILNDRDIAMLKREAYEKIRSFETAQSYIIESIKNSNKFDKNIGEAFIFMTKKFWDCEVNCLFPRDDNKNIRIEWINSKIYNCSLVTNGLENEIAFNVYDKNNKLIKEKSFSYDWQDEEAWKKVNDFINKN